MHDIFQSMINISYHYDYMSLLVRRYIYVLEHLLIDKLDILLQG